MTVVISGDSGIVVSGNTNTLSGITVSRGAGNVATNTAVGASALATNSTGAYNSAFGYSALNLATGDQNAAFGHNAMLVTSTGGANAAFGQNALRSNTTGSSNTGLGQGSLYSNTTASNNTAIGYQAAYTNSTAGVLTAVGYQAAYTSNADYVTAIGYQALKLNTTGTHNVATGVQSLYSATTGANNTAMGDFALYANTTASENTAVGYQAGYTGTTAAGRTLIGNSAGYSATGGQNTFVGNYSGYYVTSGSKNTIIGTYSGNQGGLDIRTASNYIVLSDGDGNPRGYFNSDGDFFIGNTNGTSWPNGGVTLFKSYGGVQAIGASHATGAASGSTFGVFAYAGAVIGSITQNGTTGVLYNTSSDYRLKDITGPITGEQAKTFIMALQPKQGSWKADGSPFAGFVAHEFQEVSPSSVSGEKDAVDENGNAKMQAMQASSPEVMANLVAYIQELEARLSALENK